MFERDYLMRLIMDFMQGIRLSLERAADGHDPAGAADSLDNAIGSATDIVPATLLALTPDSIATIMQVSGVDPKVTEYIARSLLLSSRYHADAGDNETAALRMEQGLAVARAYGHDVSASDADPASMERFLG